MSNRPFTARLAAAVRALSDAEIVRLIAIGIAPPARQPKRRKYTKKAGKERESILFALDTLGPLGRTALAEGVGLPPLRVTHLLQKLRAEGLVKKHGVRRDATWERAA